MRTQPAAEPSERISALWWLLPFFLVIIGGLVAFLALKDRNSKTAERMLIFGAVWTFVGIFVVIVLFGLLFGIFGSFTTSSVRTITKVSVFSE